MKNNTLKKLLGLVLAAVLVFSIVGCTQNQNNDVSTNPPAESTKTPEQSTSKVEEPKDPITLEWYYRGNGVQKDTEAVEAYVNELLKEIDGLEHVTVNMNCFIGSDYANQVLLAQTSGAQIDILNSTGLNWVDEINNGTYIAIDDYLAGDYSALYEELPEWLWKTLQVEGETYIVPNLQQGASKMYAVIPKEYAQYVDLDKLRTLATENTDDIEAICDAWYEAFNAILDSGVVEKGYLMNLAGNYIDGKGIGGYKDYISAKFGVAAGSTEVVNFAVSDEFKALAAKSAEWFAEGLVPQDILLVNVNDYTKKNMMNGNAFIMGFDNSLGDEETASEQLSASYGFDVVAIPFLGSSYFIPNGWGAGGHGVTASCENPEEAMRFLEVLNTDEGKEVYNAIVYGLEDVHYEKISENRIKTLEYDGSQGGTDATYAGIKWIIGNTTKAYLNQACADNLNDLVNMVNNNPDNVTSPIMGFQFNDDAVESELAQCQSVYKEYYDTLRYGVTGEKFEETWNEYVAKMEAAGSQIVIDEMQKQFDAWRASN